MYRVLQRTSQWRLPGDRNGRWASIQELSECKKAYKIRNTWWYWKIKEL